MKLHTGAITANGKRARVCAKEIGVDLDQVLLDFQKGDNRTPEYLAMNPLGKVPTLVDEDFTLWESGAILCYLAQKNGSALWPKDPRANADMLRWMFYCACHVDPHYTTLVVERFIKARRSLPADEALTKAAETELGRFLPVLEAQLAARPFVTGTFGLADITLGCTVELSPLLNFSLDSYPNTRAWLERLKARPSWQ